MSSPLSPDPVIEPTPFTPAPSQEPPAAGAAPVTDTPGSPSAEPSSGGASTVSSKIGEMEGDAYVATNQTFNQYQYYERQERLRLSRGHFEVCDRVRLEREHQSLFWIDSQQQSLIATLESRRFLLLCGEPELGKGSVARLLGAEAFSRHGLSEMLYCRQSPPREMEVPFQEIFGASDYSRRMVILKDALARDNPDVRRFLQSLDDLQVSARTEELRRSQSFLVLTTDSERLGGLEPKLQGLGLLQPLSPPPPDVLLEALRRLAEPSRFAEPAAREALKELFRQEGERIALELKTLPRAARFVRESLPDVLSGRISLEQALRRAHDLESWFLRDLTEDLDAWCYALALVLCHASDYGESVVWMHFDRFRQLLTRHMRQELRRFGEKRTALDLCREEDLARLARAEIQNPGFPQTATVSFTSSSYPARLWKVLLGPGRHLLAVLVPLLQNLTSAPEFYLRAIAARALGRIGELDPFGVAFLNLHTIAEVSTGRPAQLLGQLFQGILGSEDVDYRSACLRQLRRKLRSRDEVALALQSLREVGELDLTLAVQEMRGTVAHWLIPRTENGKKPDDRRTIKGAIRQLEQLAQIDSRLGRSMRAAEDGHVTSLLEELFSARGQEVLDALQYALVGLCLSRLPIASILAALQSWAGEETSEAGHFLALVFLRPHGVWDVLDGIPMAPPTTRQGRDSVTGQECGVVLYDLAATGESSVPIFRSFLEALHTRLCAMPGPLRRGMQKRWLGSLKNWARQASKAAACRPPVVALLRGLVRSPQAEVRRDVLSLLQGDRDFLTPGSELEAMAIEAITGVSRKS